MEDQKIIELFWNRSEQAIEEVTKKYGTKLLSQTYQILLNHEDSKECVNDTYLKAWGSIPPNRPEYLYAYLATIARRVAFGILDYRKAKKRTANLVEFSKELEECLPDPNDYERKLDSQEIGKVMSDFLHTQKVEYRVLFVRRYWYLDSIKELAKKYGMSESKVKSTLFRMRNGLREYLEKEGIVL